jgi:hypothetical protein
MKVFVFSPQVFHRFFFVGQKFESRPSAISNAGNTQERL